MEGIRSEQKKLRIVHLVFSFTSGGIENLLVDVMNGWDSGDSLLLCIINDVKNEQLLAKIKLGADRKVICLGRKPKGGKTPLSAEARKSSAEISSGYYSLPQQ